MAHSMQIAYNTWPEAPFSITMSGPFWLFTLSDSCQRYRCQRHPVQRRRRRGSSVHRLYSGGQSGWSTSHVVVQ